MRRIEKWLGPFRMVSTSSTTMQRLGDQTTCAGCRHENMVFLCLLAGFAKKRETISKQIHLVGKCFR